MLKQTGLCLWVGALAAAACGGPSDNDFSGPADAGSQAQSGGSSGSSGSKATGGTGGASAAAGKGGSSTGGSGGSAMGGTGNGGSAGAPLGGSSGTGNETGGTGMGGTGSETGGTGSGMGGTGNETGGTGMGGTGNETGGTGSGMGGRPGMAGRPGMGGKPGNGGSAGAEPNCDELAKAYSDALTEAKVCNADSGKDQCTELVPSSLSCGCDQFANPDNEEALAELTRLRKQAGTHCATVCPAIACLPPAQGTCESDGATKDTGHCVTGGGILE